MLVLVWKKNVDLWLCTDFWWLNARTVNNVHPFPHQADVLATFGGCTAMFMRMMVNIFCDQNFMSLLCYLNDLLVFGKTEEESMQRLEHLKGHSETVPFQV